MKRFKLVPVIACLLMHYSNGSAQISRNEMIAFYKFVFLSSCTEPFEVEKDYREEVCGRYAAIGLDKKSYVEIDSMCALSGDEIRLHVKMINDSSDGSAYPGRDCVLIYCLEQYNSKGMDKLSKAFARRMKKVNPIDYRNY
jgi:hypothetical protein